MKLFYFSGTGNSYRIAKKISKEFHNAQLVKISLQNSDTHNPIDDSVIGVVFPLYYFGLPIIVRDFLQNLNVTKSSYVFIIVTRGIPFAGGAKKQLRTIFKKKNIQYNYFQYLTLGNNFIFYGFDASSEEERMNRNRKNDNKIRTIIKAIKAEKNSQKYSILDYPPFPFITFHIPTYGYKAFQKSIYNNDSPFEVDQKRCTKCKKCEQHCPVDNISVSAQVKWKHDNCQLCLACYNCCPHNAIQYIDMSKKINTSGKKQYWNF